MPVPTVDRVVRELLRIYGDAEADLRRLLGSPASTEFLRGRSDRLLRQIQALTRELKGRHRRWSARALTQVYRTSSRAILGAGAGFSAIDRTAVQVIAERVVRDLDVAVDGAARNLATVLRRTKQEATGDEALLRQVGRAKALGLTRDDLAKRIARTLRDGATRRLRGAVPPDVAARLWPVAAGQYVPIVDRRGRLRRFGLRHYANLVGHTWAMGASNEAALRAAERFGTDLVQVSVHTNVPDEACRRVQGKVYSLAGRSRDFPPLHFALPLHPNCVPAGTVVTSPQVLVSTARWYEGPLRHLQTRRGHRLAVTPNHPVLTPQGWVPAALLVESGYVLSCTDAEWVTGAIEPDHNHRPALIEQIVETLGGTAPVTAMSMPVAPKDFHGDGIGSEVYVVRAHGLLGNRVDPEIREPALHQLLIGRYAEPPSLTRHGGLTAVLPGLTLPTDGSVCDGSIGTALLRRPRSRQEPVGLHLTTDRHTRHAERSEEFYGRPAEFARKGLGAFAGDVAQDDLGRQGATGHRRDTGFPEPTVEHARADAYLRGELAKRYPGLIGADELIEVRDEDFRGHVYNLQTSLGFYIANGIPVGNCRHRFVPVNADTLRERGTYNALSRFSQSQEQVENLADYRERIRPTPRRTLPELRVVSESTTEVRARLLDVISAARLEGFLQRVPLRQIDFVRRMPARTAHGVYSIQQQRIWVNTQRPRSSYGQEWVPGSNWSVSMLGRNALEAKQRTFAHELGHHIHLSITRPTHLALGAEIGTQADAEVARAFRSGRPLTVYASRIDYEYFAESFAAYVFERERLRQFDPVGHDMVRRVLQLAGIE